LFLSVAPEGPNSSDSIGAWAVLGELSSGFTRKPDLFLRKLMCLSRFLALIAAFLSPPDWKGFTESDQFFAFFVDTHRLFALAF
jgi:hypothetical protein